MTIPVLATLEQLMAHLKITPPAGSPVTDDDLQQKLDTATQLVCEYIADRHPADPSWIQTIESWSLEAGSPNTVPPPLVVLAVLIQAGDFYRFRGDDGSDDRVRPIGDLIPSVTNLLIRYKNPAFA